MDAGAGAGENSKCYQETELANAFTELGKAMPIMPFEMEVAPLISGWIIFNWASIMVHIGFIIAPKAFKD